MAGALRLGKAGEVVAFLTINGDGRTLRASQAWRVKLGCGLFETIDRD